MAKHESIEQRIENGQLVSEIDGWWEVVTKEKQPDGTDQTVVTRVKKHSTKVRPLATEVSEDMFTRQVPRSVIHPTKRQKPTREGRLLMMFGDIHFPFEDRRAIDLALLAHRELMPDTTVCAGDNQDLAMFSRFERREEWIGSTQEGLDREHQFLATLRANVGWASDIFRIEGNHDMRLERELRAVNGELLGLRRANAIRELGVLTLPFLLRLEELQVTPINGYPNAELWHSPTLKSYHGRVTSPSGRAPHTSVNREDVSTLFGHDHGAGIAWRTIPTQEGHRTIFSMDVGTLATIDGTTLPSQRISTDERGVQVPRAHNWQQGVAVVYYTDETATPYWLPITPDGINIHGKTYKS